MTVRILVIEDEERIRQFLQRGLSFEGYRVDTAADGQTGLDLARENPPDLVLLDLMLPDMDGYDITRLVRNDTALAQIPVIMITGQARVSMLPSFPLRSWSTE